MTEAEAEWLNCPDPLAMLDFGLDDKASDRKLRLFAVACCQCSRQLLLNNDLCNALEVGTRYADGQATTEELAAAYQVSNGLAVGPLYERESERQIRRWAEAVAVANATVVVYPDSLLHMITYARDAAWNIHRAAHRNPNQRLSHLLRDIFGNPFRPAAVDPAWLRWNDGTAVGIAQKIYDDRDFTSLPVLADALEEAGCTNPDILTHCRQPADHVRGCWVVDLVLGKK